MYLEKLLLFCRHSDSSPAPTPANCYENNSMLYAGTPALKGDFTRTGQRTKMGLLQDGTNSAIRYVVNNFQDHRCGLSHK